jgi:hypothetical protein
VSEQILAVRADEYLEQVGMQRFKALPREEIETPLRERNACPRQPSGGWPA